VSLNAASASQVLGATGMLFLLIVVN